MLLQHTLIGVLATHLAAVALAAPASTESNDFVPPVKPRDWQSIVIHHSATVAGSVASIDEVHRRQKDSAGRPWLGIGYHFVVGNGRDMGDGEIQPTFRWNQQLAGAHAGQRQYNDQGIGICLIGNFEQTPPTEKQLASLGLLLRTLCDRYRISPQHVVRHQDVKATLCPGRLFPWDQVVSALSQAQGS